MSAAVHAPTISRRRVDVAFLAILALALAFRLYRLDVPLVDGHSWRQVTNADIARHFATTTWNPLTPQVSWGGIDGIVGMEFPLLHYLIGMAWRLFGESETMARGITATFSMASVVLVYLLGRDLFSVGAGRGAALLMGVAPSSVFFGRSVLSDTPMVTLSIAAIWCWHRALEHPSTRRLVVATICTALAGLIKLPAVIIGVPIVVLAWKHRGAGMLRDRDVWFGGVVSVALIAAWYWYSDGIATSTGLTQAIFRPSGRYGPEIGLDEAAYETVSHWSTLSILTTPEFYQDMVDRFWGLHLTPLGFAGALVGWWLARDEAYVAVVDAWIGAGAVFLLASAQGQSWHQFHQLPLIPPLALYFGIATAPLFSGRLVRARSLRGVGVAACLALIGIMAFRGSTVVPNLYRDDNLQVQFIGVGDEIRSITQSDALLVTVDYQDGGTNSPMSLYYSHRQGWSFDVHAVEQKVVERLRAQFGARYFLTFQWTPLGAEKPDLIHYLGKFQQIRLHTANSQVRLFDLGQPNGP